MNFGYRREIRGSGDLAVVVGSTGGALNFKQLMAV